MTDYFTRNYMGKSCDIKKGLSLLYPDLSYNEINKLLRRRDVFVNGQRQTSGNLSQGDEVSLFFKPDNVKLNVCYEDKNFIAIYKKKGLQSTGDVSFENLVNYKFSANYILLHRLDTNTEGILLFAKTTLYADLMKKAMGEGKVKKHYYATVYGNIDKEKTISIWLKKDADKGVVKTYDKKTAGADFVETHHIPLSRQNGNTLVEAIITKGKTHQIRASLAHIGHFILGDSKYGMDSINRKFGFSKQQLTAFKLVFEIPENSKLSYLNGVEMEIK